MLLEGPTVVGRRKKEPRTTAYKVERFGMRVLEVHNAGPSRRHYSVGGGSSEKSHMAGISSPLLELIGLDFGRRIKKKFIWDQKNYLGSKNFFWGLR